MPDSDDSPTQLPVNDVSDVLAILPTFLRPDDPAAVRDGILAALTMLCCTIQEWAEYAAAQADALRATGAYEDEIGSERSALRGSLGNEDYRALILSPPDVVSPEAVIAAANAVLKPFTSVQAQYCESWSDRACFFDATWGITGGAYNGEPLCYFYDEADTPRSPDYADRLYASEGTLNGGTAIANREPGAARFFDYADDVVGRIFFLRVPDLSSVDAQDSPIYNELEPNAFYIGTGAAGSYTTYLTNDPTTSSAIYANIVNAVERVRGQSMRWTLFVDVELGS
jgi:hypothetical protein